MRFHDIYSKLFVMDRFFTIAIRRRSDRSILEDKHFQGEYVMPANREHWAADPMLIDEEDKTYLFYEAVEGDKGHLEVAEVGDDCHLKNVHIILKDECHYSYPYVFRYKKAWYMIPESADANRICLYRAKDFPYEWEPYQIILQGEFVDTTIFEDKGALYLLTFSIPEKTERVTPHAYRLDFEGKEPVLREIPWTGYDELSVRGAGPLIRWKENLYRPAQISQEDRYGDGLVFFRVYPGDVYKEERVGELRPEDLRISGFHVDGLHTYSRSQRYEAIDVRCCVIQYLKPIFKLFHRI